MKRAYIKTEHEDSAQRATSVTATLHSNLKTMVYQNVESNENYDSKITIFWYPVPLLTE